MNYQIKNIEIKTGDDLIIGIDSFSFSKHGPVFITGKSGAGKTVFLRFLAGYLDFFEDSLIIKADFCSGKEKFDWKDYCLKKDNNFYLGQDIDNFVTGLYIFDEIYSSVGDRKKAENIIADHIFFDPYRKLSELSQGQKKLVLILKALFSGCDNIFLDEPFTYLDREERDKVSEIIRIFSESGKTVYIAGHGMELFHLEFTSIFEIDNGNINEIDKKIIRKRFYNVKSELRALRKGHDNSKCGFISLNDIFFSYNDRKIFDGESFAFDKGVINGLCGRNGSGKTTLAKILCNRLKIRSGNADFDRNAVFIANNPDMYFLTGTCEEELEFFSSEKRQKILSSLDFDVSGKRISELSYGQKIRFLIYIYLNLEKDVFILDEIFAGQDMGNIRRLSDFLRSLSAKGKTVIIITQDVFVVRMIADRIVRIEKP